MSTKTEKLKKLVKEMIDTELDEMARISTNIKVGDKEKFDAAKDLYKGNWVGDLLQAVEDAGDVGIPQPELAKKLGKSGMQSINPRIRQFLDSGIITKGEYSVAKKEKPESTGQKGRPVSEKTKIAMALNTKFEENPDYEPTPEEIEALGEDFINKLKLRAKGELKRGRKIGSTNKPAETGAMEEPEGPLEEEMEEEELVDEEEKLEPLNEQFLRMQKRAGLIK